MNKTAVVVLAAGKGARMKSEKAKVLHEIGGKPLLSYVIKASKELGTDKTIVVVGHQSETVKEAFPGKDVVFVEQKEQLGTGHAVMQAENALRGFKGNILILSGDVPLITADTLKGLMGLHVKSRATITVLTAEPEKPYGYGRIIKDAKGDIKKIVEEKDATAAEKKVREINAGIYCVASEFLFKAMRGIKPKNAQKEYYLTDIVGMAVKEKKKAATHKTADFKEVMGINSRLELAEAELIQRTRILNEMMKNGVTIIDPACTYIAQSVKISADTIVFPGSMISGETVIGKGTVIGPGCIISDAKIGDGVNIKAYSVIDKSEIEDGAFIGPMAHVRPESVIKKGAHIGNFVEVKKSKIGEGSKANHLSYIGDATIGKGVNIGAGTITCNYDGVKKHRTVIEDNVFVGSDTQLVAPVRIGEGSLIGAGTTVTEDVPEGSLVLSRVRQLTKEGLAKKYLRRKG
ncbi:MAG: bifunctional UDP-N-acetylglucosamine diphosphorylase/glucosamine-1-phosphate N-acetyltransferase GlmU [Deltaproteobacteria bacterium]|nr:bifunctional UDP-N-acetylglucosamine diphosphorylase/glucosamine-1-phosphate N-acetyltransferase GlmU [Deltaproteobacteria bacterium]